ncbi:hypothetical protein NGRA_0534 [Nosema granulosis]|uniref:Uncharacterized protein n=1 Tax=Nosema granulosis TaxID=83296 RepID=A0A9P6L019_9MICR|nr:hypothetical protein NGRA_0534 [Nosema granulosis]
MKQEFKEYLRKILEYPTPSTNLYAEIQDTGWSPMKSSGTNLRENPIFKKLLHIKWYNSTLPQPSGGFLAGETLDYINLRSCNISYTNLHSQDDTIVYKERQRQCVPEPVAFGSKFVGVLSIGKHSKQIESDTPNITVGIKTRKTIIFESCDRKIQVDLSSSRFDSSRFDNLIENEEVKFVRFKDHKELFKEFCIENAHFSLREIFPSLRMISNKDILKELCLEFISIKSSLFYATKTVDCFSLGESLLFFSIKFGDGSIVMVATKILEYIKSVLSDNMIAPNIVGSYIFLFETVVFITKIYLDPKEKNMFREIDSNQEVYKQEVEYLPVRLETVYENILEGDLEKNGYSKGFNRILSIYQKILSYFNSNLHSYLSKEPIEKTVNMILSAKNIPRNEILGVSMLVSGIYNFFNKKTTVEYSGLLELIKEVLRHFSEYLSYLKKSKYKAKDPTGNKLKPVLCSMLDLYYSLRYIDNRFVTDVFCYGVLDRFNSFNISNIKKLLKYKEMHEEVVQRLKENRELYNIQKKFCGTMQVEIDPTYNTVEKKVLINISSIKSIRSNKAIEGEIEKGKILEEEMYRRYKIYIYEYLKEKNTIPDFEQFFK